MNKIYNYWLKHKNVSSETKNLMKNMSKEQIEASFNDEPLAFGTAGYRAIMGPGNKFLNVHTFQQLAVGYARYILSTSNKTEPEILLAHDNRADADIFSDIIIAVMSSHNIKVKTFNGNVPMITPIVSFCVRQLELDGAINITASHNPKEYTGFKAYNNTGSQVLNEEAQMISANMDDWRTNLNKVFEPDYTFLSVVSDKTINEYFKKVKNQILFGKVNKKQPIILTTHHGAGSHIVPSFLKSLGHNIINVTEQNYFDANFTNSPFPNPEDSKSFALSEVYAKKHNAKIMLGIDPDGDRLAVAIKHKNKWHYLNGNQTGILLSHYILHMKKQAADHVPILISTYVSTNLINNIAKKYNAIVLRTATGFKNIGSAMDKITNPNAYFCIGFEEAIGACAIDFIREKDCLSTAAFVLDMINYYQLNENLDLIEVLYNRIFAIFGNWHGQTISIGIKGFDWKQKAEKIEDKLLNLKLCKIGRWKIQDIFWNENGSCLEWILDDQSWIKFRISGTEPKFKIYYNLYFKNRILDIEKNLNAKQKEVDSLTQKIKEILKIK